MLSQEFISAVYQEYGNTRFHVASTLTLILMGYQLIRLGSVCISQRPRSIYTLFTESFTVVLIKYIGNCRSEWIAVEISVT